MTRVKNGEFIQSELRAPCSLAAIGRGKGERSGAICALLRGVRAAFAAEKKAKCDILMCNRLNARDLQLCCQMARWHAGACFAFVALV
jgi:hypothetical protein